VVFETKIRQKIEKTAAMCASKMGDLPKNLGLCIRLADGFTECANFVEAVASGPPFVKAGQGKVAGIVAVSGEALAANRTGGAVVIALFYGMVACEIAGTDQADFGGEFAHGLFIHFLRIHGVVCCDGERMVFLVVYSSELVEVRQKAGII
jgi:hypothetical protein